MENTINLTINKYNKTMSCETIEDKRSTNGIHFRNGGSYAAQVVNYLLDAFKGDYKFNLTSNCMDQNDLINFKNEIQREIDNRNLSKKYQFI